MSEYVPLPLLNSMFHQSSDLSTAFNAVSRNNQPEPLTHSRDGTNNCQIPIIISYMFDKTRIDFEFVKAKFAQMIQAGKSLAKVVHDDVNPRRSQITERFARGA